MRRGSLLAWGALGAALGVAACSSSKEGAGAGGAAGIAGVFGAGASGASGAAGAGGIAPGGGGTSSGGTSTGGTQSGGTPSAGAPSGGTSSGGTPAGGTSGGGASSGGTSSGGTAGGGASGTAGTAGAGNGGAMVMPEDPACHTITTDAKFAHANCNNEADKCYFSSHAAIAYDVGSKCATMTCKQYAIQPETADAKKCFTDCFVQELMTQTGKTLSAACATCSNAVVICGAYNCLSPCLMDPHSADCTSCLCTSHAAQAGNPMGSCLVDAFADCAGFAIPPKLVGCPTM